MTTIYEEIKSYLEKHTYARERRNKDLALVDILKNHYNYPVSESLLPIFSKDFTSYDRIWRLVLSENESLRGTDYETKEIVEQRKEIELGYSPGYYKDLKQTKLL